MRANSMARRITRAFITGRPSSEMATTPACFIEPMAANSSPALPFVMAPMGNTLTIGVTPRSLDDVAGHRGVVVDRRRVGHAADGGESAGGGGARAALDGFGVLESRLAQVHVHVDEAGRDDQAGGVERLGAAANRFGADAGDAAVFDQHVGNARRVPDAGSITRPFLISERMASARSTLSSTAMRTAMPFSTWLRITERCESATSEESSRPRLMGPGCITMASGLRQFQVLQAQAVEAEIFAGRERRFVLAAPAARAAS